MKDLELAEQQTREFMANEFKEYHDLTGLTEFKHYQSGPHERNQHYLEVKGNVITLGHIGENLVLYKGTIDGKEGEIDKTFFRDKLNSLRERHSSPLLADTNLELRIHGDLRRIAAKINFRARDIWNARLILTCDHDAGVTTAPPDIDDDHPAASPLPPIVLTLYNPNNPHVKVKLDSIWTRVDGNEYHLTPTETSFVIHKIEDTSGALTPVTQLIVAYDHTIRAYIFYRFK
jgi:hypothetical protein